MTSPLTITLYCVHTGARTVPSTDRCSSVRWQLTCERPTIEPNWSELGSVIATVPHGSARFGTARGGKNRSVWTENCAEHAQNHEPRPFPLGTFSSSCYVVLLVLELVIEGWRRPGRSRRLLLIEEWGDERVQTELNTCKHNQEIYSKIAPLPSARLKIYFSNGLEKKTLCHKTTCVRSAIVN